MSVLRSTVKSPVSTHFTAKRRVGRAVLCLAISAAAVGLTRFFRKRHNSERVEKSKADDCGESDTCQKIESLAGGRVNAIKITGAPLRLSEHIKLVESDVCGAVSTFSGVTRNHHDGKSVVLLRYEAYTDMAIKQLLGICADTRKRWDVHSISIAHRTGIVEVRKASVVIAVSSVHRAESLEAVRFIIDSLKKVVTIWKEEHYDQTPRHSQQKTAETDTDDLDPKWKQNSEFGQATIASLKLM